VPSRSLSAVPARQAIDDIRATLDAPPQRTDLRVQCRQSLAHVLALDGEFETACPLFVAARTLAFDKGLTAFSHVLWFLTGYAELLAGDVLAAEEILRARYVGLKALDDTYYLPTIAAALARSVLLQGRWKKRPPSQPRARPSRSKRTSSAAFSMEASRDSS
jgi:hypothetical protein